MSKGPLKLKDRRPLVRVLFGVGLTLEEVAVALRVNRATVRNDIRALGGSGAFPDRPARRQDAVFRAVIKAYAGYTARWLASKSERGDEILMSALASRLREADLLRFLQGAIGVCKHFAVPVFLPERLPYARLLGEVFGVSLEPMSPDLLRYDAEDLWRGYLEDLDRERVSVPWNGVGLETALLACCTIKARERIAPLWTNEVLRRVDQALATLTEREQKVLRLRHGFDGDPLTLEACKPHFGVSTARIRVIQAGALRKLRHPSRKLRLVTDSVANALHERLLAERHAREREEARQGRAGFDAKFADPNAVFEPGDIPQETLWKILDEFEVSVRAANCLQNANLRWVGELVIRTEEEMLKTRNFGRKSLREIHDLILKPLGLRLGMRLSPALFPGQGPPRRT